jgi:signal transduction histidine kinase
MWQRILHLFRRSAEEGNLLADFEDSLMIIVDPEQLASNLLSKLRELIAVEKSFVYLADNSASVRTFSAADKASRDESMLPTLAANGITAQWFRANRQILSFRDDEEVISYLRSELQPFQDLSVDLAIPLVSMDRLIGIVFLRLGQGPLNKVQTANLELLSRHASLAFENALLFKDRLRQNERMLRAEQLATMGQFAAGIAHELRNPLTAIRSTVQYLGDEFDQGTDQRKLADDILGEVDRLNKIAGNLLLLAQPTESNPEETDVRQETERCVDFIAAKAKSQTVKVQTNFGDSLPTLTFDPAELRQVLLNVMMNGLQAMPEGGTLLIRVCCLPEGNRDSASIADRILIHIEDEGPGIRSDVRQKVFEPFFTTKAGGTGLGLAICNSIVGRYNGEIWMEQAECGGVVVKISLPIPQAQ